MLRKLSAILAGILAAVLVTACAGLPFGFFGPTDEQLSQRRASAIVDALNERDADALAGMFTKRAHTEKGAEIDAGVQYLLSLFPHGHIAIQPTAHNFPDVNKKFDGKGHSLTMLRSSVTLATDDGAYELHFADFTRNSIDADEVGLYALGAVRATDTQDSAPEVLFSDWLRTTLYYGRTSPGIFVPQDGTQSRETARALIDALDHRDSKALEEMFTPYAWTEYSKPIDAGLRYLFSLFRDGDIRWSESDGASLIYKRTEGPKSATLVSAFYNVAAGDSEFRLFFAEYTDNSIDPDNVGVYALGVVPASSSRGEIPEALIYNWASLFDADQDCAPDVYVPDNLDESHIHQCGLNG